MSHEVGYASQRGVLGRFAAACLAAVLVTACGGPPSTASAPAALPTTMVTGAPTAGSGGPQAVRGIWGGTLSDPNGTYPIRLVMDCAEVGQPCAELEYEDPGLPGSVLCASELTFTGMEGEALAFTERFTYHAGLCLATAFRVQATGPDAVRIDQLIEGTVCCSGTLRPVPTVAGPTPGLPDVVGLGRTTSRLALGGATTQYAAAAQGAIWFPVDDLGAVARLDAASGELTALVATGEPRTFDGPPSDPHAVVAGEAGIWVAQAGARAVGRIDPSSNTVDRTIDVGVVPYALALDGNTLWVASFQDDAVVAVDLASGVVGSPIEVPKPTGIAAGLGAVWVVEHRADAVARIDPKRGTVTATLSLGERGPDPTCGMCVENIVISGDAAWTANNHGRSVSRIDPDDNSVTTLRLPLRVWAVSAEGGAVWASQYDATPDGQWLATDGWGLVKVDAEAREATGYGYPGAFGVLAGEAALWLILPGRRGDDIARVVLEP